MPDISKILVECHTTREHTRNDVGVYFQFFFKLKVHAEVQVFFQ